MARRDTILSVLAAAFLVGGYLLLRGACAPLGSPRFVIPHTPERDLTESDRTVRIGDTDVAVTLGPRPLRALAELRIGVRLSRDGRPVPVAHADVALNMEMDMGPHGTALRPTDGGLEGTFVLPPCAWGGTRWYARIAFDRGGGEEHVVVLFDLRP